MSETTDRIDRIIVKNLGCMPEAVKPETLLVPAHDCHGRKVASTTPDLNCDSLDIVEIVMELEEEFGVQITDQEGEALNTGTVADLHALIERKLVD